MNGIVLGLGILASSLGLAPAVAASSATPEPVALTVNVSDGRAPTLRLPRVVANDEPRPAWQVMLSPALQGTAGNRSSSKTARVIGVALGGFGGFMAGGMIGYALAAERGTDDDGVSGLRGVVIGAPIGAVVGAVVGYRLAK
jgi:hypothetical protein